MDIFYNAEYIEINGNISVNETFTEYTEIDPAVYIKVLSVLIIRAGLFIAEVISIPSSNVQVLVLHNIIDLSVTFVSYGLIGYIFAFGKDFQSLIGTSGFIGDDDSNFNEFIQGWSILVIVAGLLTAAIGDRVSFFAGLVMNFLIACVTFPLLFHWILYPRGWMKAMTFAGVTVSYKDYSHSCLIHMAGGYICFLGMFVLDKRMLRFKDLDSSSIPDVGPNLALFGYFLTLVGFVGFSAPTQRYMQTHLLYNFYGIILVNMIFAIVGTMLTTLLLTFICPCRDRISKWANLRYAQSGIAGVAMIAGGVDVYHPLAALGAGLVNGLIFFLETHIINKSNLEDFCNISAVHFFSGLLGTLLPPVLGIREGFKTIPYNDFVHFLWQLLCDATILAYLGVIFYPLFVLFDRCGVLRTLEEDVNHKRAVSAMRIMPKVTLAQRLFDWSGSGDASNSYPGLKTKAFGEDTREQRSEKVNILYQKNGNDLVMPPPRLPLHGTGDEIVREDTRKSYTSCMTETKTAVPAFEEIDSVSARTSGSVNKEGAEASQNASKVLEMNVIKSIRNISDSKLFSRLKESVGKTKHKKHDSRSGFGSTTNVWLPGTSGMSFSLETEV